MNEREIVNEIQTTNFDEIITNPQNINYKKYICSLLEHLKFYSKYVMASINSHATQRDQNFKLYKNVKFLFHFKPHVHSSSFVSSFKWTKHKS